VDVARTLPVALVIAMLCACDKHATTSAGARAIPVVDDACATDADCAIYDDEPVDFPAAQTYACCPGCTHRAGNRASLASFHAACSASPPPSCAPLGCITPLVHAVCREKHCAAEK
jgi:hypothetical protein